MNDVAVLVCSPDHCPLTSGAVYDGAVLIDHVIRLWRSRNDDVRADLVGVSQDGG
jgi:hypothetical protein